MTLFTSAMLPANYDIDTAFEIASRLAGSVPHPVREVQTDGDRVTISAPWGQLLRARVTVEARTDGEQFTSSYGDDQPQRGYLLLTMDTGYAYEGENGCGCADLHAWILDAFAREVGQSLMWRNENDYTWHGLDNLSALGDVLAGEPGSPVSATGPQPMRAMFNVVTTCLNVQP